jgi:serine/threonine protein kinase/DNA-binding NarL/FixJ family response regulator
MSPTNVPLMIKDRYRLVEWIGKGKMGVVYRARDQILDREVAIKLLSSSEFAEEAAEARFLREARTVARLAHPNIMAIYDVGQEADWHYLVLELIPGENLHAVLRQQAGALPVRRALEIILCVLQAVDYAHTQGVIHRDIKPENVMLTPANQVKVTDFGLAFRKDDVRLTQEGALVGTVLYMAPELASGCEATPRSDLYAVGAVLYELRTGRPPFQGPDFLSVLSQSLRNPPEPPRQINPDIPAEIEEAVLRLLAKDPAERYASAADALAALNLARQPDQPAMAPPTADGVGLETPAAPSLLESILHGSAVIPNAALLDPDDEALLALPGPPARDSALTQALLLFASLEDTAAAIEDERHRQARLLQQSVLEPLQLLLAQANTFEQTLGTNPSGRMAVSVLATLARQIAQGARDLEANLHPATLTALGLEPALHALANQVNRIAGLQIDLRLERLRERLPERLELMLFRLAQDGLEAAQQRHASQAVLQFQRLPEALTFSIQHNGAQELAVKAAAAEAAPASLQRLRQAGGAVETGRSAAGFWHWTVRLPLAAAVALTPRELEIISAVAEGLSNKEIAARLFISPRTVNFHLDNLYAKLGVNTRTEAAIYALRQGWIRRGTGGPG